MTEDQQRALFEIACWSYYQGLKSKGWSHALEGDPAQPESIFWRSPSGKYGVNQIEAAWNGYQMCMQQNEVGDAALWENGILGASLEHAEVAGPEHLAALQEALRNDADLVNAELEKGETEFFNGNATLLREKLRMGSMHYREQSIPRYKVVQGSQSNHCCFSATVVDTSKAQKLDQPVCECFERSEADLVAAALNAVDVPQVAAGADLAGADERLSAHAHKVIADFLARTGKWVTNDASRDAAIAAAVQADRMALPAAAAAPSSGLTVEDVYYLAHQWATEVTPHFNGNGAPRTRVIFDDIERLRLCIRAALAAQQGGDKP